MDIETPNELLNHLFSHFGKVTSSINDCVYKKKDGDSELAAVLDGIPNGERQFWMNVSTSIPSYGIIDGKRVKIFHAGQSRTCARCHQTRQVCPGEANAKKCEESRGAKNNLEEAWKKVLQEVNYTPWPGGEIELEEEFDFESCQEDEDVIFDHSKFEYNGLIIDNIGQNTSTEEVNTALINAKIELPQAAEVSKIGERSVLVTNISQENIISLSSEIESKRVILEGKVLRSKPYLAGTPNQPKEIMKNDSNKEESTSNTNSLGTPNNSSSPTLRPAATTTEVAQMSAVDAAGQAKSLIGNVQVNTQSDIPGLTEAEKQKAKKKQVRKARKERNKKLEGTKEKEKVVSKNSYFTPSVFKSIFAQQEERRLSFSGRPDLASTSGSSHESDLEYSDDGSVPLEDSPTRWEGIINDAEQVSSSKTLPKLNVAKNAGGKRSATSPADGDIASKKSGIPRVKNPVTA